MAMGHYRGTIGALSGLLIAIVLYRGWGFVAQRRSRRRPWPNDALQARDNAIMDLHVTVRKLEWVVSEGGSLKDLECLRCVAIALGKAQNALRELEGVK